MKEKLLLEIKKNIIQYKRANSLSKKHYYYNSTCCLLDVYKDLTKEVYPFFPCIKDIIYHNHFEKNKYNILFSELSEPGYRNMIESFSKNGIEIIEDNIDLEELYFDQRINYKTACMIILGFFNQYDYTLLPFVENILKNNVVFCNKNLDNLGYSNNIQSLNKTYIVLFANENNISIEILVTLVHEIAHTIYNKTLDNRNHSLTYNNFLEVLPYFFEQIFIEYCFKSNIYGIECLKAQKNDIIGLYNYLTDLNIVNKFIEKINLKNLSLKLNSKELSQIDGFDFNSTSLTLKDCDQNYLYSYGTALGFYYSKLYSEDPEIAKEHIKKFILDIGIYRDSYILKNYGINYDEFISCEFLEPVILENQKRLFKNTQN